MKKKSLKKSKAQNNQKYKDLTSFLFNINDDKLQHFVSKFNQRELDNFKYRVINQLIGHSHIVWYMNEYMNSLYEWNKYSFQEFMYSVNTILKMAGITQQSSLRFSRYQNVARNDVYATLNGYLKIVSPDKEFNNNDLVCLFRLYEIGFITDDHLTEMKAVINPSPEGKAKRASKETEKIANTMFAENQSTQSNADVVDSAKLVEYKNNMLSFIKNRAACNTCPLQKSGFLLVSTNATAPQNVDVLFIGEGSSKSEISRQLHMSGMGVLENLTKICDQFKLTYAFINLTMCDIDKATSAAKRKQSIQSCNGIYEELKKTFASTVNVLFGDLTRTAFGIKDGRSTKLHATQIDNNIISVLPDKLNNKREKELYASIIETFKSTKFNRTAQETSLDNLENGRTVSRITPDLTLFDIKEINSKLLYILINKEGEKVYYIEDLSFPVHIKPGSMSECEYIADKQNVETIVLNSQELKTLKRETLSNLKKHMDR